MSILKAETLSNLAATKTMTVENVVNATAKSWAFFNGSGTVNLLRSYNVSGLTDLGTGYYRLTYTTSLPNSYPSVVITPSSGSVVNGACVRQGMNASTTVVEFILGNTSAAQDFDKVGVAVFC